MNGFIAQLQVVRAPAPTSQTDVASHIIGSPTMLGVVAACWHLLHDACKRTQQLPTLLA